MGKAKNKEGKDNEFFLGQIRALKSENRNLKKRLKQLERREYNYENPKPKEEDLSIELLPTCEQCGKGFVTEIILVGRRIMTCTVCAWRSKAEKL